MTPYTDGDFASGAFTTDGPAPRLIDAPVGAKVKLRFRSRDIAKAFIRHRNGNFSAWTLAPVDWKERTFRLRSPIAQHAYK